MDEKTIVVTGGLGFIGGHFIELCLEKGYRIFNIDKVTYASNISLNDLFKKKYPGKYFFIKEDIKDLKEIPFCKYIVHFAAESHVDNAIRNSQPFIDSNIIGVYNMLMLLVKTRTENQSHFWSAELPTFIYISTDEVFGDILEGNFKENDRYNPSNPYSATKASAELLLKAWSKTYNINYKITRTTNNYGSRQHQEKLIPQTITRILNGEKVPIFGSGEYIRNWIHVKDNCEAIFLVMTKGEDKEEYHISSEEEYSTNQIVQIILNHFKKPFDETTVSFGPNRAGQDLRYALDNSKIKKKLDWNVKYSLKDSLAEIINYYKLIKNGTNTII